MAVPGGGAGSLTPASVSLVTIALLGLPAQLAAADRVRVETGRAIVYFDSAGLPRSKMEQFARLVDRGVRDIEAFLRRGPGGTPFEARRITFYVSDKVVISRARRSSVMLPLTRVRRDGAPYLHETIHVLLPARSEPVWLSEGFASYVESWVAENVGGYDSHVFSWAGNRGIDRDAARHLRTWHGQSALDTIGTGGVPWGFYRDRRRVAPPFYVLSHSFVKFLVERAGLHLVVDLFAESDVADGVRSRTGRSIGEWKKDWLTTLGR